MGISINIKFDQLKDLLKQLTAKELNELRILLDEHFPHENSSENNKIELRQLLLNGPTLTKSQLNKIDEARKSMEKWRE